MVDQSIAGPAERKMASDGDRSGRARLVIALACVVLAAAVLLSLTSGASDASAVKVVGDWLFGAAPGDVAMSARDRLIVYDIR
ncbi:iron ABC transporter, partial [Mesorhizobium sp. B1-1-5]